MLVGNNNAHAKNMGLLHAHDGTRLSELYDAVPNLYQADRINWGMAMSIDGEFDHRKISAERLINEATSWSVLRTDTIESIIRSTIRDFTDAHMSIVPKPGVTPELAERLAWNAKRFVEGNAISAPKQNS